jgi:hypothetical protein
VREVREELGLDVALTRLVGVYSTPNWVGGDMHQLLFAATLDGGSLRLAAREVLETRLVERATLPEPLLLGHRHQVLDALDEVGGSAVWVHEIQLPEQLHQQREALLAMRDQMNLAPRELYQRLVAQLGSERLVQEVAGAVVQEAHPAQPHNPAEEALVSDLLAKSVGGQ